MWIRQQLERTGATQAQLGAAVGLTSVQINKILSGVRGIKAAEADRIRDFFGHDFEPTPARVENGDAPPARKSSRSPAQNCHRQPRRSRAVGIFPF